jgi:hypothetical protein
MDSLINHIRKVYHSKGYVFFEKGKLNLNIGGIRSKNRKADSFDDIRFVVYKNKSNVWTVKTWVQTTDPGLTGLKNPCRKEGCAILVPGQYRGAYKWGHHKGRNALVQIKPVSVYRDWNKDNLLDFDPASIMTGLFGINIHDPWKDNLEKVGNASLGCQVAKRITDHSQFMDLCTEASKKWGDVFTYTLFNEEDFEI